MTFYLRVILEEKEGKKKRKEKRKKSNEGEKEGLLTALVVTTDFRGKSRGRIEVNGSA